MNNQGMATPDGGQPPGMGEDQPEEVPDFRKPTAMQKALLFPYGDSPSFRPWFKPKRESVVRVRFPKKELIRRG